MYRWGEQETTKGDLIQKVLSWNLILCNLVKIVKNGRREWYIEYLYSMLRVGLRDKSTIFSLEQVVLPSSLPCSSEKVTANCVLFFLA